jgi:hypothetical protein
MAVPCVSATTGESARKEITKNLRRFGCESVGFMDDFDKSEVMLAKYLLDKGYRSTRS